MQASCVAANARLAFASQNAASSGQPRRREGEGDERQGDEADQRSGRASRMIASLQSSPGR
jgi:hypothetical protein